MRRKCWDDLKLRHLLYTHIDYTCWNVNVHKVMSLRGHNWDIEALTTVQERPSPIASKMTIGWIIPWWTSVLGSSTPQTDYFLMIKLVITLRSSDGCPNWVIRATYLSNLDIIPGTGWDRALKPCSTPINRPFLVELHDYDILHLINCPNGQIGPHGQPKWPNWGLFLERVGIEP